MSRLWSSAERDSPGGYSAYTENARRRSTSHCGRSIASRVFERGEMLVQFTVVVDVILNCH